MKLVMHEMVELTEEEDNALDKVENMVDYIIRTTKDNRLRVIAITFHTSLLALSEYIELQ